MDMIYALIIICSAQTESCFSLEDRESPHATEQECLDRVQVLNDLVPIFVLPDRRRSGDWGPFTGYRICDTIEEIQSRVPGAYPLIGETNG